VGLSLLASFSVGDLAFSWQGDTFRARMLDLNALNPQQRLAVQTTEGPVLILAGAGTGKTRVITFRIAHLVSKRVSPANILAVTFTNKAAREMKERVRKLIPRQPAGDGRKSDGLTVCTFHSLGARVLREHIERIGYKRNFVIYSESEQVGVIKKILSHFSIAGAKPDAGIILNLISRFKNGALSPAAISDDSAALAFRLLDRYGSALRACNALDFDDLLVLTLRLLEEHSEVLKSCRERFRYVMVDEYQDTNAAQFKLVHLLTNEHRNLCVVGDDDQSIYGWRGAEVANLLDLEKHYPEVKVVKLEQNYRSTNTILQAANAVIKNNARRRPKQLWSQKGQGSKIRLDSFDNEEEEARAIVEDIEYARLTGAGAWKDHAILFRTNQQSRPLEMALRHAKVRYHLIGGQSYFDRREVRDFLAYLKTLLNPHDDISLLRIANVPARGLSDATMERLLGASQERHCSVYAAMRHTDVQAGFATKAQESIRSFLEFIETTRAPLASTETVSLRLWADGFLKATGYLDELRRLDKDPEVVENRIRNLSELVGSMDEYASGAPAERLEQFLEDLSLDSDREADDEIKGDAVVLITVHSCKGLEFPHVFVVGLEDGLLPHSRSKIEGTLDEERRLFYVAITRAQKTLHLSYCHGRKKYGQSLPCHPSPFLKELPPELVENAAEGAAKPVTTETGKSFFSAMRAVIE
jgi:superfamily I DNA/RNA helicase